jgi:Helix-turn-helix domain
MTSEYARQNAMVFEHLRSAAITPREALDLYGIFRLAARVFDLRQAGHEIITLRVRNSEGNSYAEYHMTRQAGSKEAA